MPLKDRSNEIIQYIYIYTKNWYRWWIIAWHVRKMILRELGETFTSLPTYFWTTVPENIRPGTGNGLAIYHSIGVLTKEGRCLFFRYYFLRFWSCKWPINSANCCFYNKPPPLSRCIFIFACMHLQYVLFEAGPGQAIIMHHQTVHGVGPNHSETAWELRKWSRVVHSTCLEYLKVISNPKTIYKSFSSWEEGDEF